MLTNMYVCAFLLRNNVLSFKIVNFQEFYGVFASFCEILAKVFAFYWLF